MNMPVLIAAFLTLCFGALAIYSSFRADKMTKQIQEQEKSLKAKDDFTHMVVHELRAPLTAMKGAAKLLSTSQATMQEADKEKLLTLIHEQSDKMLLQIGTILDAAKMDNGRFLIHKTPGDLTKIVTDAITIFKSQADLKHVTLSFTSDQALPVFPFDQGYLTEVMNNLLSNSLKFTSDGGSIAIHGETQGAEVKLTITDTGVGIPIDKQEHLFTKFTQAQASSNSTAGSSGLGLYIVKGIIEAHKGTVTLSSEENKGTTITILLPMS